MMEFFICGTGRSGTSIFNRMVGFHSQIWSFKWETQIFAGLPPLVDIPDSRSPSLAVEKFAERAKNHLFKRDVGGRYDAGLFELMDEREFHNILEKLRIDVRSGSSKGHLKKSCASFADAIFKSAAEAQGKSCWCEKTPRNLLYADKIQEIYPSSKFVNVVRDGREVVSSILERKFWPMAKSTRFKQTQNFGGPITVENAIRYWVNLMEVASEMRERVGESAWLDVRLEDIGSDPAQVQSSLEDFLGVQHDPQFLEAISPLVDPDKAVKSRWQNERSSGEVDEMMRRMSPTLAEYGYI